jgi:hypothetical protein
MRAVKSVYLFLCGHLPTQLNPCQPVRNRTAIPPGCQTSKKNHATSIKVSSLWCKQLIFGTARGVPRYHAGSAIGTYPINTKPTGLSGGGFSMPLVLGIRARI